MKIAARELAVAIGVVLWVGVSPCLRAQDDRSSAQQSKTEETVNDEDYKVFGFQPMGYPVAAYLGRAQGAVVVRVKLDAGGRVVSSTAISGAKTLIPEVLANARTWIFDPNPARTAVIVYLFRIHGKCYSPSPNQAQLIFREPNIVTITGCDVMPQP